MKKLLFLFTFFRTCYCNAQNSANTTISKKLNSSKSDSTRYRYIIGTNFDFIDGLDAKGLSHHINITLPAAFTEKSGFIAGIYQNKQVSVIDTINYVNRGNNLRESLAYPSDDPSYVNIVRVDSANLTKKSQAKSLGLYFQPVFCLFQSDDNNTKIYGIGHLEYVRRTIEREYNISSRAMDTLRIAKTELAKYQPLPREHKIKTQQDEGYFGAGVMLYHKNEWVELQAKGMFGAASMDKLRFWYGVEVSLMELKSKFELGVSYKGLLPKYPPYYLNAYLSKVFELSKIGELLK